MRFRREIYIFPVEARTQAGGLIMLVEFSVANFRSVKTRQVLSMTAGSSANVRKTKSFSTGLKLAPYILRAAALYGANGSGKTSILKAVSFMQKFIIRSARERDPGSEISGLTPYLFSKETRDAPSEFEISFIVNNSVYQYGFVVDQVRVWREWLYQTQKGVRTVTLINRVYDPLLNDYDIVLGNSLTGAKAAWKRSTRQDALLLSTAVSLNSPELRIPYDWIKNSLRIMSSNEAVSPAFTARLYSQNKDKRVLTFIKDVGLDVVDITSEEIDPMIKHDWKVLPAEIREFAIKTFKDAKIEEVMCAHLDEDGEEVFLPFEEESDGTRALISLAGPWIDIADHGLTILVDELHNSLHPFALKYLLDSYFTSKVGKGGGQIVFTTHDIFPMEETSLHRDQIWFVDKGTKGGTALVPLSDYNIRSGEPYRTGYIKGRYGGVPLLRQKTITLAE